jgi:catechol 2,3-dioxygenase-like lactoylglutathione lyase family enzyme
MSLHGLLSVTIGVPNVEETAAYYAEFGLAREADGWFSTLDVGRQLRLVSAPAALVHAPGRPGRHDDRCPLSPLMRRALRSAG